MLPPLYFTDPLTTLRNGLAVGVQIRKLYEERRYPGALAVQIFRDVFRSHSRCRVCAIGVEANPKHTHRLNELESRLQAAGAPALVLRGAAAIYDGEQQVSPCPPPHPLAPPFLSARVLCCARMPTARHHGAPTLSSAFTCTRTCMAPSHMHDTYMAHA
jgi:hypothetical protein